MKVSPTSINFGTTARFYRNGLRKEIGTNTNMFRDDVDWNNLAQFEINHFKNKNKVNIVQFASSDGSEAYTQIISLLENRRSEDVSKFFPIQAYDIDEEIHRASASGLINMVEKDKKRAEKARVNLENYFELSKQNLVIKNDNAFHFFGIPVSTYRVSEKIRNKVEFHNEDMFYILDKLKDDSNTILMCRNVLSYMDTNECEKFLSMAAQKLKAGSLLILGKFDTDLQSVVKQIHALNFKQVIKNVFLKI